MTNADEMAELAPLAVGTEAPVDDHTGQSAPHQRSSEQTRVLDAMTPRSARPVEDVAARAGLSVAQVQSALGALELDCARTRDWLGEAAAVNKRQSRTSGRPDCEARRDIRGV